LLIPPAVLVLAGALAAGIRPWELFRGSRPLLFLALGVILLRGIRGFPPALDLPGLLAGLRFGAAMVLSFAAGALFYSVTTMREIRETLEGLFPARRLSLGISLMLGYIPRFFELWENANLAWEARRGRGGFSRIAVLVPLVTERMMEAAAETAAALESRHF
jgi:biotin transport system permease protein